MQLELTPGQIRWVLACIRASDHAQATARTSFKFDYYESVVFELLSQLNPDQTS